MYAINASLILELIDVRLMRISEAKLCRSFPEKFANIKFGEGVAGKKTIQLSKIKYILWNIF